MFIVVAILARPDPAVVAAQAFDIPFRDPKYLYLVAANIGAVIMPWMVFFQQSAIVEKRLTVDNIGAARADTFIGSILTQIIMAAILVATAATLGAAGKSGDLDTVQQISGAITPFLGEFGGKLLFGLGLSGAALVAAIVVTVTAARTLGEILKVNCSLDHSPREAPWFYGAYTVVLIGCAAIVASGANLVSLSVGVQVMNAMLLPTVLGFLYLLARRLPEPYRLQGVYAALLRRDHRPLRRFWRLFGRCGPVLVMGRADLRPFVHFPLTRPFSGFMRRHPNFQSGETAPQNRKAAQCAFITIAMPTST